MMRTAKPGPPSWSRRASTAGSMIGASVIEGCRKIGNAEGTNARGQTREDLPPVAAVGESGQLIRVSSTRRFCARPAAVLFDAIGLLGPKPAAVSRSAATPFEIRYWRTDSARAADSRLLTAAEPVLSVWPPTWTLISSFATSD